MKNRNLGNKYEIIERLGRGGMAEVYRAHHVSLDRYVAIKVLHDFLADDPEFKNRFEKEARNIARLKHPHIVQVYDFEYDAVNESYYMVMELIDGTTLKDLLQEFEQTGKRFPLAEALRITKEAASALAYAHKAGMIHRDVKPANLLLDRSENNRVVLTDFGIAKMITSAQFTVTGGLIGTPAYMSPEQGVGETGDERSDIYSLGVILFQMVTGQLLYDADTPLALILKHLNDPIPSACALNPELPSHLDYIIAKSVSKEAADRYQKASELIEDIEQLSTTLKLDKVSTHKVSARETKSKSDSIDGLDGPTQPYISAPQRPLQNNTSTITGAKGPRRIPNWFAGVILAGVILFGGYVLGTSNGIFPGVGFLKSATPSETATEQPDLTPTEVLPILVDSTDTPTSSPTATISPTYTKTATATLTDTALPTETPTNTTTSTLTQTNTPTHTLTLTVTHTPNSTQTLAVERTATFAACSFDYAIIDQNPKDGEDGGFFQINTEYQRVITLLNTGTCSWERNTSLTFVNGSGESFSAGPRIFIREPVEVGAEVEIVFLGTLPSRGSVSPLTGLWQLRTPGQIPIGEPITISVMVYDPGR